MIEIVAGTNRPGSNSLKVAKILESTLQSHAAKAQVLDLSQLQLSDVATGDYFKGPQGSILAAVDRVTRADGVMFVVPEYNGSYPGILKLFIDYWKYPDSFEARPVAFVGIGSRWGGLRPVEHLQQVFGYRNGYVFPERVFIANIKDAIEDGKIKDDLLKSLVESQCRNFVRFISGLKSQGLDANSRLNRTEKK